MNEKHGCSRRLHSSGSFNGHLCANAGIMEHNGKWFCKMHHPDMVRARRASIAAELDSKIRNRMAHEEAEAARMAEQKRRAECFPALLETLQGLLSCWRSVCNAQGWDPEHVSEATKTTAAIAAATKRGAR